MQITIKLKGFLKIAIFFVAAIPLVFYGLYKACRYASYRVSMYREQKKGQAFEYAFTTDEPSRKGYLLLTSAAKDARLIIMDLAGRIVLKKAVKGTVCDFRQWNINGHIRYTYAVLDSDQVNNNAIIRGSTGHIVVLDSALNEIRQIHLQPYGNVTTERKQDLDGHDFLMLSDDHYFVMSEYTKTVNNIPVCLSPAPRPEVAAVIIQEVKNGHVVWQWDGTRYPDFYLNSQQLNKFYDTTVPQDYMHINAMILDPKDSNLVVSFRNENQLAKINRLTGEIMWRLGGRNSDFAMTVEQVFMGQHNPTFIDSSQALLLFDNGIYTIRPYSRVLEFKLDEQKKTITSFKSYKIPEPFTNTKGSVQKIGDDYLICGGSGKYILEVNSITGAKKMEIKTNQMTLYRAYLVKDIPGIDLNKK